MKLNPFINYLDQYNVMSPNHSKIYDEYIDTNSNFHFNIETKIEKHILEIFNNNPHSVIVTGNAGDGKTRLCRIIHDNYSEEKLKEWPITGILNVKFPNGTIRIVKDLSELNESVIKEELSSLQQYILSNHSEKVYYLIAANEGKLTKFLSQNDDLQYLRHLVSDRFLSHKKNDNKLSLINLLNVTSSVFVKKIFDEWNDKKNWDICDQCSRKDRCVIFLNHIRTSDLKVQNRLVEQYELLDYLDIHITLREMLIHLSYTLTGGLNCKDIFDANYNDIESHAKKIYYENFYGVNSPKEAMDEIKALNLFKAVDPGISSHSLIDDFILNGDLSSDESQKIIHQKLFSDDIDLLFGYYKKQLELYRSFNPNKDHDFINKWMPTLRRKYFFEVESSDDSIRTKLLPYDYYLQYVSLFKDKSSIVKIRKDLVHGLNRAFSKKLVNNSTSQPQLYVTTENLMIHQHYLVNQIIIKIEDIRNDIDRKQSKVYLDVSNIAKLEMNLSVFEYLMRLANGGMFNTLQKEVDILINTFKNDLIKNSYSDGFTLNVLRINEDQGTYGDYEIMIPSEG